MFRFNYMDEINKFFKTLRYILIAFVILFLFVFLLYSSSYLLNGSH